MILKMETVLLLLTICFGRLVSSENVAVEIFTDKSVHVVSDKFVSFSVDPEILMKMDETTDSQDCLCMASSLSPGYIRLAGPSTNDLTLEDSILKLKTDEQTALLDINGITKLKDDKNSTNLHSWSQFAKWLKTAYLTPFVALNNVDKLLGGSWNPTSAIQVLSMVDKMKMGEFVWQLGYECDNEPSERYLKDLKTLKIIMDAFSCGRNGDWKIASGDISRCLGDEPFDELKSYMLEANNFLDAIIMDSDTTGELFNYLSGGDQESIKAELTKKDTQMWKTYKKDPLTPVGDEAVTWLKTLGDAAKDGYSVVFKDLLEKDMQEPTLAYYVTLLHKKLVGPQVLDVSEHTGSENVSVYSHCASLPSGPLPGGVTIFAANQGVDKATVSMKMAVKERGGEIMQYVMYENKQGKIMVNGYEMREEGDLQPAVKKVKPFKTLTVTLPPKSVGFWIVSKANAEACKVNKDVEKLTHVQELKHKQLQSDTTAEFLQRIIHLDSNNDDEHRQKRSTGGEENFEPIISEKAQETSSYDKIINVEDKGNIEPIVGEGVEESSDLKNVSANGEVFPDIDSDDFHILVIHSIDDPSFNNFESLFSLLKQITTMLQLEKEFLDISTAVLTPENVTVHNASVKVIGDGKSDYNVKESVVDVAPDAIDHKLTIVSNNDGQGLQDIHPLEVENNEIPPLPVIQNEFAEMHGVVDGNSWINGHKSEQPIENVRSKRGFGDEFGRDPSMMDENLPFSGEEELPSLDGSPNKNIFAPASKLKLPTLRLPELPKLELPRKVESLDELVKRAQDVMRNLNPELADSIIGESRRSEPTLQSPLLLNPLAARVNLKAQMQKNQMRIEQLRHKMQARLAEMNLRARTPLHNIGKREIAGNTNDNVLNIPKSKITQNKEEISPRKAFGINKRKTHLSKIKKALVERVQKFQTATNKILKIKPKKKTLLKRGKRFIIAEAGDLDKYNDLFRTEDFEYDEKDDKNNAVENSSKTDNIKDEAQIKVGDLAAFNVAAEEIDSKSDVFMTQAPLDAIVTPEDISEIKNVSTPCSSINVHSEMFTAEDIKEKLGIPDDMVDSMVRGVATFWEKCKKKAADLWDTLKA